PDQWLIGGDRGGADRIRFPNGGRINHEFGILRVFRAMLGPKTQADPLQPIDFSRFHLVRAADIVPQFQKQRGDPAHSAPSHPDEMNSMALARQHFWKIEFRGEHHDSIGYIFPSFRPRARPRFSAPAGRKLPRNAEALSDSRS